MENSVAAELDRGVVLAKPLGTHSLSRVADWERWTGMVFPVPRYYVVPGALQPVVIDSACDQGFYEEP